MDTIPSKKLKLTIKPKLTTNSSFKFNFKFIDLFCGIGGFHLAMKQLGGQCVFASDIDKNCQHIYQLNHGCLPVGDIKQQSYIPPHDILCGGFPCQAFSNAGKKRAFEDKRGLLFDNIVTILKNNKTPFAILENVKHIKRVSNGDVYRYIYDQLHSIGYRVFDIEISPTDINIPQNRQRVIFIVIRNDLYTEERKTQFLSTLDTNKNLYRIKNKDITILETSPHPKYNISEEINSVLLAWDELIQICVKIGEIISPIIPIYFQQSESIENSDWKNGYIRKNNMFYQKYKPFIDTWYQKNHEILLKKAVYGKLEWQTGSLCHDDTIYKYFVQIRQSGIRVKKTNCFPTLVAIVQNPIVASQKRYLTPRECARLQSIPDDFTFGQQDDKLTYKQLGNGVNMNIVKLMGETLLDVFSFYFSR